MSKLPQLIITETDPTPLLKDFTTFLRYLTGHEVHLTKSKGYINGKFLLELNQQMAHTVPNTALRSGQTLYPLLHMFYHLVLSGKLFQKIVKKSGKVFLEPNERLQLFEDLTNVEKYFFLLETFWVDADWKELQAGHMGWSPIGTLDEVLDFLSLQKPCKKIKIKCKHPRGLLMPEFFGWEYFLLYFSYFGFWEVIPDPDIYRPGQSKHTFRAQSIIPTNLGVTVAAILNRFRSFRFWNLPGRRIYGEWNSIPGSPLPDENMNVLFGSPVIADDRELKPILLIHDTVDGATNEAVKQSGIEKLPFEPGESFFLPFVKLFRKGELANTLPREGRKFQPDAHIFKISLRKNLWRRIEISGKHTLLDLHYCIQEAYDFDDDHLYSFFMDGKAWSHERFSSPHDSEGPYVDEVSIGELGLYIGQDVLYLFDYGDQWVFRVVLEEIREKGIEPDKPKIIEKKGENPEQYGYYEE